MSRSAKEQAEFNMNCYGCDPEAFIESVENSMTFELTGPSMVIMSLLSDAQHEIEYGMKDNARKTINRAKMLVNRYMNTNKQEA